MIEVSVLLPAFATYIIATASPGPATLAIMATAMRLGRKSGLALAAGVICGSLFWGSLAALGLSALLARYGLVLETLKIAGGVYLIWLAVKSFRAAKRPDRPDTGQTAIPGTSLAKCFQRGLAIHLTNPKAVFSWAAIFTLALAPGSAAQAPAHVLAGCFLLGICIFGGYALLFSTPVMIRAYGRARRWIEAALGVLFGLAGIRLITTSL